jgi:hypothetical protein
MQKLRVDQIYNLLRFDTRGRFFSVTFERRTNGLNQRAGEIRTMLCRTAGTMSAFKRGVIPTERRDREDFRNAVITVWDCAAYLRNLSAGMDRETAGREAFRRIDIAGIKSCSIVSKSQLPPTIKRQWHRIHNAFRLANMPQAA